MAQLTAADTIGRRSERPPIAWLLLVAVPGIAVGAGLLFVLLPAFGYFPALGGTIVSLQPWRDLLAYPGLASATRATLVSALVAVPVALGLAMLALAWIAPAGAPSSGLPRVAAKVLSWLLATPHAAFALGLAFLVAPSGWLVRIAALALPIDTPPDLLVPRDPWGLSLAAGLVLKEMPFLFFAGLTALSQLDAPRMLGIGASLGYQPGVAWLKLIAPQALPADPAAGLRGAGLRAVGRRHGAGAGPDHTADAGGPRGRSHARSRISRGAFPPPRWRCFICC